MCATVSCEVQSEQDAAARRLDHITPMMRQLLWLPVRQRVMCVPGALVVMESRRHAQQVLPWLTTTTSWLKQCWTWVRSIHGPGRSCTWCVSYRTIITECYELTLIKCQWKVNVGYLGIISSVYVPRRVRKPRIKHENPRRRFELCECFLVTFSYDVYWYYYDYYNLCIVIS